MASASEGIYLYCFARPHVAGEWRSPGVDGRGEVRLIRGGKIAAVCSPVALAEFQAGPAAKNEGDPEWLIPRACRHEAVVEEAMSRSPVLPVRFGALFSSPRAIEALMARQAGPIDRFLEYIADKEEWAVKGFLSINAAAAALLEETASLAAHQNSLADSPGKRYLQQKQWRATAEREARRRSRSAASEIIAAVQEIAVESRTLKPQPAQLTGAADEMTLNLAFLASKPRLDEFHARIDALADRYRDAGLSLERTGPWPPFSFCPALEETLACSG